MIYKKQEDNKIPLVPPYVYFLLLYWPVKLSLIVSHHLGEQKHLIGSGTLKIPNGYNGLVSWPVQWTWLLFLFFCLILHCSNSQHLKRASLLLQCFYMCCLIKPSKYLWSKLSRISLGALVYSGSYNGSTIILRGSGKWEIKLPWCGSGPCALLPI